MRPQTFYSLVRASFGCTRHLRFPASHEAEIRHAAGPTALRLSPRVTAPIESVTYLTPSIPTASADAFAKSMMRRHSRELGANGVVLGMALTLSDISAAERLNAGAELAGGVLPASWTDRYRKPRDR